MCRCVFYGQFSSKMFIPLNSYLGEQPIVFANGRGDLGPISGCVNDLKMVLDISLLNTQQYKVRIKFKVEQSRERSSAHPYTSV